MKASINLKILFVMLWAIFIIPRQLPCEANLAANYSFETPESTSGGWPSSYGDWNGDYSSIVGTTSGITPLDGSYMLSFEGTSHSAAASSATTCEVPQLIDVSAFADLIASGNAVASASAYFNRIAGDAQTDTLFAIKIYALEGDPASYPVDRENFQYLLQEISNIITDSDPDTWQLCQLSTALPVNTDYIAFQVTAYENIYNDDMLYDTEFDGHFADLTSLEIVPEPATIFLFGLGGLALLRRPGKK